MKHVPNLISYSRIALSLALFFTFQNRAAFTAIYLACGVSDILDGYLARKTGTDSDWGARLDSWADLLFFAVIISFVIAWLGEDIRPYLPLLLAAGLIRFASLAVAAYKYRTFAILHTWGNKFTGLLVFTTPLLLQYRLSAGLWLVCLSAVLSAVEEFAIHLTSAELDRNRRSLWHRSS